MTKSYNVGFALMSEHSAYNAALGLARVVRERGHNPIFFVSDQTIFAQFVRTHGFQAAVKSLVCWKLWWDAMVNRSARPA